MDALSVIWFSAAVGGAVAALAGLLLHVWRQQLLLVSAGCFLVCGILGILSIGLLFLALAAILIVVAVRGEGPPASAPCTSDSR
jgi:hypothetical protein